MHQLLACHTQDKDPKSWAELPLLENTYSKWACETPWELLQESMDASEFLMKTLKFPIIKPYNVTFFLNEHNSRNTQAHMSEKSAQQQFEGNMSMRAVRGLWELLTKCQTITLIMNSSDQLPWLPIDFISPQQWVLDKHIQSHKPKWWSQFYIQTSISISIESSSKNTLTTKSREF